MTDNAERRAEDAERQRAKVEAHTVMLLRNGRQVLDQRNQLAAVIEKAEDYVTRHYLDTRFGDEVLPILATVPADALRELKAKAWDEGYFRRMDDYPFDPEERDNPYREGQS